jgi:hypothetical protein
MSLLISGILRGMKKTPTKLSTGAWQDIKAAYLVGGGLRALAREAGIPENTILVRAHREKWSDQRQAALAKILPQKPPEESLGISHGRLMERHLLNMMALSERLSDYAHAMPDGLAFDAVAKIDTMDRFTRRQLGLDKPGPAVSVNLFSGEPKYEANPVFEAILSLDN